MDSKIRSSIFSKLSLILIFAMFSFIANGQDENTETFDYSNKRTFNIGSIKIEGAVTRDRNAIKSIAGLREGKEITIPGDDIPKAIKALLKLRLFEDVQIIQEKIEGDLIYLRLLLIERPTLSRYSIKGEKKNKHKDLTEVIDATLRKGSIVTEDLKDLTIIKLKEIYIEKG